MVNLLIKVVGLLSLYSVLHSGSGIKVAAEVSLNIHIGQLSPGTRATGGTGEWSRGRLLLLQHDTLAECAQTIYFGFDAMDYLQNVEHE